MTKWIWRQLQWLTAPSEKEIRESLMRSSLLCWAVISLIGWAPAFAMTPDEMRGESQRQYDHYIELEINKFYSMLSGAIVYDKATDSFSGKVIVKRGEFPEEALRLAIEKMERQSWIVTMKISEINSNELIFIITERKK